MPRIHILPDQVADRIAAGEVVERPSSVVKELMENAIDAGSTIISVFLEDGGKRLIRVEDDGEGMEEEDAILAFERHATSKLSTEGDMELIATLGFRGEALPSIASVSRVRLVTARPGAANGCEVVVNNGVREKPIAVGAPSGTTVEVSGLFHHVPARRKFLKTGATELSHAVGVVTQHALARPDIHFRVAHGGREILSAPRAESLAERIVQVYGVDWATDAVPVDIAEESYRIRGMVSRPHATRGSRSAQEWFVGGRPVRSPSLSHALYEGYGPLLAHGRHPSFVLFADGPRGSVDINVHPAKREVRFREPQRWHSLVRRSIEGLWSGNVDTAAGADADAAGTRSTTALAARGDMSATGYSYTASLDASAVEGREKSSVDRIRDAIKRYQTGSAASGADSNITPRASAPVRGHADRIRVLGQIKNTFIVAEVSDAMQIIDQHTAHERVLFDRLWSRVEKSHPAVQPLLFPVPLDLKRDQRILLEEHRGEMEKIGLEIDGFGGDTVVVRAVPQIASRSDIPALIDGVLEDLAEDHPAEGLRTLAERLTATVACHGAVRARDILEPKEMSALIEDLYKTPMPWSCPHGRPIILAFSHKELDRMFQRR